jgi:RHS repeat-associated protein
MKVILPIVVVLLCVSCLSGQIVPVCDTDCGPNPPPTGSGSLQSQVGISNARGTGSMTVAAQSVGKTAVIEGSQSYTYAVPLFSIPGRGLNTDLTLYYNSFVWDFNRDNNTMVYGGFDSPSPGFRLDYGLLEFSTDLSLGILTEPNGARHLFLPTGTANQYQTLDSSYIGVQYPGNSTGSVVVTYKSGVKISYQPFDTAYQFQYRPYQIEDTNGNVVSITYLNANSIGISTITDTVGRVISFTYDSTGTMLNKIAQLNSSGQSIREYRFTWLPNQILTYNFTLKATAGLGLPPGYLTSGQTTVNLLTKVIRPDGTAVSFDYVHDGTSNGNSDWGIVKTITELSSTGATRYSTSYIFPAASAGALTRNPTFGQQTVNDGVNSGTWSFQGTRNSTGSLTCFGVLSPLGRLRTTNFSSNGDSLDGLPTQSTLSSLAPGSSMPPCTSPTGQILRTINTAWVLDANGANPRPQTVTTIFEDGTTQSQVKYNSYDNFGQVTDFLAYGYGTNAPGPLFREVVTNYASLGSGIVNRPSHVVVKDGSGAVVSRADYNYDETHVVDLPTNPAGHDAVFTSTTTIRGNLTSTVRYSNAAASTGLITSTFSYDSAGNRLTSQIGCCTKTQNNFSATTQYAYPDSVVTGPTGTQLVTGFTYNIDTGTVASTTDANGNSKTFHYDADNRTISAQTPDGIVTTSIYDDSGIYPSTTSSNSANSLATKTILDGRGRTLTREALNGTALINETSFTYDIEGKLLQSSMPFGPGDTPVYTTFSYDSSGRRISAVPPAVGNSPQNGYLSQYALAQFTDSGGNQQLGHVVTATDPAGKQRKHYTDAFGRLVRVDEPGQSGGSAGTGSVSISGSEQSASVPNGGGATAGTGSVSFSGTERSAQVLTHNATKAMGSVTISGFENSTTIDPCADQSPTFGDGGGFRSCPRTVWDSGTVSLTVNGLTKSVSYGQGTTTSGIASGLASAFGNTGTYTVTALGSVITITANNAGASGNSIALSAASSTSDFTDFGGPSFTTQASGSTLSGGSDNGFTTMYDTGALTINVTIGGTVYSKSSTYGQSSTSASIASDLANRINSDTTLNQLLIASSSNNTLNLTTTATGASTADPFSVSSATNSQYFAAGSSSFVATVSGTMLVPGQNGTIYDSGVVLVSIAGFTAKPIQYTANYSQGSTSNSVAATIAGAINGNPVSPVTATVTGGSNTITLTAKTLGSDTNYSVSLTSSSSQSSYFAQPSFGGSSNSLTSGSDPSASLSTPLSTYYTYNNLGQIAQIIQGQQIRSYTYDSLGRLLSQTVPETGNRTAYISYTDFGAVAQVTDPRLLPGTSTHLTTTFGYDNLNRLTKITFNDGTPGVVYTYNPPNSANNTGGRVASISNGLSGTNQYLETYQYDIVGRPLQCVKNIGGTAYTIQYHYNPDGTLASLTYPSGRVVTTTEDTLGRLAQIATNGANILTVGSYNSAGNILSVTYGNGMQGAYGYNQQGQLSSIEYDASGSKVMDLIYDFGGGSDNGQIQGITDAVSPAQSTRYIYDELGRLKAAQTSDLSSANSWMLKFSYDRYGNRLSQIPAAGNASMPLNEISIDPTTNRVTSSGFAYDEAGNTTSDGLYSYRYDAANQLISVAPGGSTTATATFVYDVSGLRINKNGTTYIYSGDKVIAEYAAGASVSSPTAEHIYAGGQRIATVSMGSTVYHYSDHLSTRIDADSSGKVIRSYGSYPFGETWYETTAQEKWKFASYERDPESGLDYASARFDSTRTGRFMSVDPLSGHLTNPQSLNRYAYVGNDPINSADPSGQEGDESDPCQNPFVSCDGQVAPLQDSGIVDGQIATGICFGCDDLGLGILSPNEDPLGTFEMNMFNLTGDPSFLGATPEDAAAYMEGNAFHVSSLDGGGANGPAEFSDVPSLTAGETGKLESVLNNVQTGLAVVGFIPGIGDFANALDAGISLARGNYGEAALYALSAIPVAGIIGEIAIGAKEAEEGLKAAEVVDKYAFFSGPGAKEAATEWAAATDGAKTIGDTEFGVGIDNMTFNEQVAASEKYAASAKGEVHVFSTDPFTNYGNIWYLNELPALGRNPNVTKFIFHVKF